MQHLADWIENGRDPNGTRRIVRGWLAEARGHSPIINRWGPGRMF